MKFGIHNPSWLFGTDPAGIFDAVKAKAQWAETHGIHPWVLDYLTDRPDHAARFTVSVSVKGVGEAEATGSSKGEAEKQAAQAFMERFG